MKKLILTYLFVLYGCNLPTVTDNRHNNYSFQVQTSSPCIGNKVDIKVASENGLSPSIPLYLQNLPRQVGPVLEGPGGNKKPAVLLEESVLIGTYEVKSSDPTISFELKSNYKTVSGKPFQIISGETYNLYWAPQSNSFSYVGSFNVCNT